MAFELRKDEQILIDKVANLFRGIEGVGGRIKITNQRLIFQPHAINFQRQVLEVPLNQIQEVKSRKTFGILPNGMLVKLVSGQEYKFVTWKRKEIMEIINNNKKSQF